MSAIKKLAVPNVKFACLPQAEIAEEHGLGVRLANMHLADRRAPGSSIKKLARSLNSIAHSAKRIAHSVFSIVKRKSRVVRGNHKTLNAKCRVRGLLGRIFILGKAYHFFKKRKVFI